MTQSASDPTNYLNNSVIESVNSQFYMDNVFTTQYISTVVANYISFIDNDGNTLTLEELVLGKNIEDSAEVFASGATIRENLGL